MKSRIEWLDRVKGFGIFLVVYGHNFPITEKYIYTFHMPLFFLIAGIFHPTKQNIYSIKKRVRSILIPYFLWSILLYLFWLFLGRFYGQSTNYNLSPLKNFIGVFYAQGGREYMDWGIPMWFLPTIFLTFLVFYFVQLIKSNALKIIITIILIVLGFLLPYYLKIKFFWSFDVALVSLAFYSFGFYFKKHITSMHYNLSWALLVALGVIHLLLFNINSKVDMYRSIYGNEFLFILNGVIGTVFYLSVFKRMLKLSFLSFLGRFTIPILALQIRTMTLIKLFLLFLFGMKVFNFTEIEKLLLSIIQIIIMLPILYIIKKYIPILNGNYKKI